MTVVATFVSQKCIVHATDSFLTVSGPGGSRRIVESEETKIVRVQPLRGAMAYWGFGGLKGGWSTLRWLRSQVQLAASAGSVEQFARNLAAGLESELTRLHANRSAVAGIGIHFAAYERVGQYWIPELFLISNFADQSYANLRPMGIGASRETYGTIKGTGPLEDHAQPPYREEVRAYLRSGGWLQFNNGDPALFNHPAGALWSMLRVLKDRGDLTRLDVDVVRQLVRLPVETVAKVQRDFVRTGRRIVGGRIHDLALTPAGVFTSRSGDSV